MADLGRELWSELLAQIGVKGLGKLFAPLITSSDESRITQEAQRLVFGNKATDEQVFKLALAEAVGGPSPLITTLERDNYLLALAKLPREQQNSYRMFVIQTWQGDKADRKDIIEAAAKVIAHDAKLVSNDDAWKAQIKIFDLDLRKIPARFNLTKHNRELSNKHKKLKQYNVWANWAMVATAVCCTVSVVALFFIAF